ncbi:hypothetical protein HYV83_00705 [Candidatus Woesearchaeota archaeon]|nr:hypothetical protein [Candidatus Woesearchaeota archaeon]
MLQKLSLQDACAQIAELPEAELLGVTLSYAGVPVFPRMQREKPSVHAKGTGAEISAMLLEQRVAVHSEDNSTTEVSIASLDGQLHIKKDNRNGQLRFYVRADVVDQRYRFLGLVPRRQVSYSYTISCLNHSEK